VSGGAVGCGVGCVVCAKPNGRKKISAADNHAIESFFI
jgi:hypothetical protein